MTQLRPPRSRLLNHVYVVSGFAAAAVLLINAAKRAEILPLAPLTQLIAPLVQIFSIGLVIGLVAATPALRGRLGSIGATLYVAALAALVGVEFVINLVFPYVEGSIIGELREGALGTAFLVASITFLIGTLVFFTALWLAPGSPKAAIVLSVLSSFPIALRTAFPEIALQVGLVGLAIGVTWLTVWLLRVQRSATATLAVGTP